MMRDELRTATSAHHARLERELDIPESIGSAADYTRLLGLLYGFYAPLEQRLLQFEASLAGHGVHVRQRLKTRKLARDLLVFGVTRDAISTLPRCAELPHLATDAHALGCLYVLEGSTLGGQVIARRIRRVLHIEGAAGLAFFRAYGAHTGRMWQAFVDRLNAYPATGAEAAHATQSARDTFAAMERWLLYSAPAGATRLKHGLA
jgi:heme oxygenase